MAKKILSVVAGVLVGWLLVFIGDAVTHMVFPPPTEIDFHDKNALIQFVKTIPAKVFILMLLFWLLSAFCAGFVSAKINKAGWKRSSLITGCILLAATILNMFMLPHPVWMVIATVILYLPAAYLGGKTAS